MGKFWVIEGIDGAGKTTLAENLAASFRADGVDARRWSFPTKRTIGTIIRSNFLSGKNKVSPVALQHLFMADLMDAQVALRQEVEGCDVLICDRHPLVSSWVYSGLPPDLLLSMQHPAYVIDPDKVFILNISYELAKERMLARIGADIFDGADKDTIEKRRQRYLAWHVMTDLESVMVDASVPQEELVEKVKALFVRGN